VAEDWMDAIDNDSSGESSGQGDPLSDALDDIGVFTEDDPNANTADGGDAAAAV